MQPNMRAFVLAAALLGGCGGGGGGSSPPPPPPGPPPPPAPTASISVSNTVPYQGDQVTLTWSSANATSCTGTDAWSGTVATAGSQPVTVPAAAATTWGLTCTGAGGSISASAVVNATIKPFFVEVPNALTVTVPTGAATATIVKPLDVNADGKDDLVFHWSSILNFGLLVNGAPCTNAVRVYVQQPNGTFTDQTTTILPGGTDFGGGCSRKGEVVDLNADGKLDILYALSREDGRIDPPSGQASQLGAFISSGSGWTLSLFGPADWFHAIGTGILPDGRRFATGEGTSFTSSRAYTFSSSGAATLYSQTLPLVSPNAIKFMSSTGSATAKSDLLIQTGKYPNVLGVEGYYLDGSNTWQSAGSLPALYPQIGTVNFYPYSGGAPSTVPVLDMGGGQYIVGAGGYAITESCQIALSPGSPKIVAMKMQTQVIKNYVPGVTVNVYQGDANHPTDIIRGNRLIAARIVNNAIEYAPLTIINEQRAGDENYNFFDCTDVNGDGYEDISAYPYSTTGKPHVYLNNKAGAFAYIGNTQFPTKPDNWGEGATAILHDFDKDGLPDLFMWPGAQAPTTPTATLRFYRGLKTLQ
jgi:hypothetical protein